MTEINKQMFHQRKKKLLSGLLVTAMLTACSDTADKIQPVAQPPKVKGELHLDPNSPKKAYVKTAILSLTQHPLLEPLTGKITYNESVTSRISSPVAGRVIAKPVALGTQVQSGTILLELDSPDVAAAEADYAKAQANLTLASKSFNRQQELYVGKAASQKVLEVRCELPNADGRLLPGMYATINVESNPGDLAFVIPLTAVFTEGDSDYVFIALDKNHFQQRQVEIGLRLRDKAVITEGLKPNEQLVTEGALTLRAEEEVETDSDKQ
jgi:multidrug efflux pump subunit AcrA (membrane-fusion protein)